MDCERKGKRGWGKVDKMRRGEGGNMWGEDGGERLIHLSALTVDAEAVGFC